MTVYTATPEMCHPRHDYGMHKLPYDWPGKEFRLHDNGTAALENLDESPNPRWSITRELRSLIEQSKTPDPTTEVTSETGPTAIVSLEKYTADLKSRESIIEQQREEMERLRRVLDENAERHLAFKKRVGEVAMEYAQRHDWCSTVAEALEEIGVDIPQKKYSFTLSVVYRVTGTKEDYNEPDSYMLQQYMTLDADGVEVSMDGWDNDDFEVEYVQHDVMDIEEVTE